MVCPLRYSGPVRVLLLFLLAIAAYTPAARAQGRFPPDSFTNLKVLPPDISARDLVNTMRGFALGLGVRCSFCHVGEEGKPLATYDFASDRKPAKLKARVMLRMVQAINGEYLPKVHEAGEEHGDSMESGHEHEGMEGGHQHTRVVCATCHRGLQKPQMLQDVLLAADQAGGADSAVRAYRALREQYYGSYSYDFTERPLLETAQMLQAANQPDDALRILQLNVESSPNSMMAKRAYASARVDRAIAVAPDTGVAEVKSVDQQYGPDILNEETLNQLAYQQLNRKRNPAALALFRLNAARHPDSWNVYDSLGEGLLAAGDTAGAAKAYRRSLELNPDNTNAANALKKMGKQ